MTLEVSRPSLLMSWLVAIFVDIVFCPPSIRMQDLEKSQNIIFSPWGRKNIQNDMAQPIQALGHPKCLF